jgi:protein gp37
MASASDIEWTEATWNPIAGCSMVSPGCTNCYAMRMAARLNAMGIDKYRGTVRRSGKRAVWTGRVNTDQTSIEMPLRWRKPKRIFVNSMSDLFQEGVDEAVMASVWEVMKSATWHTFQILTKRPERMRSVLSSGRLSVLPNVWLGTSVESEAYLHRVDTLRETPASVRFISFEPLIGPIIDPVLTGIDWAIVGGESGPGARPIESSWVEELRDACVEQSVAFFFKQWGGKRKKSAGRKLDGRTWDEYPEQRPRGQDTEPAYF